MKEANIRKIWFKSCYINEELTSKVKQQLLGGKISEYNNLLAFFSATGTSSGASGSGNGHAEGRSKEGPAAVMIFGLKIQ